MPWNEVLRSPKKEADVAHRSPGSARHLQMDPPLRGGRTLRTRGPVMPAQDWQRAAAPHLEALSRRKRHPPGAPRSSSPTWPVSTAEWPASSEYGPRHPAGLIPTPRRRRRTAHPGRPLSGFTRRIWTADENPRSTAIPSPSRTATAVSARVSGTVRQRAVFKKVFRIHGLPERIRTAGTPFASMALARLSKLSAWWLRLGIARASPASPHPRARPPEADLRSQQKRFDAFRHEFNHERPHEALQMKVPAELYRPSDRPYPKHLKSFVYPGHYEVRKVSTNGGVRWNARWLWVSQILGGLYIGFEEVDHQAWDVYFGPVLLGRFFEKIGRITDPRGLVMRNPKI